MTLPCDVMYSCCECDLDTFCGHDNSLIIPCPGAFSMFSYSYSYSEILNNLYIFWAVDYPLLCVGNTGIDNFDKTCTCTVLSPSIVEVWHALQEALWMPFIDLLISLDLSICLLSKAALPH